MLLVSTLLVIIWFMKTLKKSKKRERETERERKRGKKRERKRERERDRKDSKEPAREKVFHFSASMGFIPRNYSFISSKCFKLV